MPGLLQVRLMVVSKLLDHPRQDGVQAGVLHFLLREVPDHLSDHLQAALLYLVQVTARRPLRSDLSCPQDGVQAGQAKLPRLRGA